MPPALLDTNAVSDLMRDHPQHVQGVRVMWIYLHDLAEHVLRPRKLAGVMIGQGQGECFRNGSHGRFPSRGCFDSGTA